MKLFIRFGVFAIAASSTANEYTFLLLLLPRHSHSSNSIARTPCPPERRCHDPEDSRELERAVTHAAQLHLAGPRRTLPDRSRHDGIEEEEEEEEEESLFKANAVNWRRGGGGGGGGKSFIQGPTP